MRRWIGLVVVSAAMFAALISPRTAGAATFPDGTGTITVPTGWHIASAYRGSVDLRSTTGAAVVLGLPHTIIDANSNLVGLAGSASTPIALPGDIGTALRQVIVKTNGELTNLRARTAPPSFPGVPAFYIYYQFTAEGKAFTAIGYFTAITYPNTDFWQLYSSAIVSPTPIFAKTATTMTKMWASWRPNGNAPSAGSEGAEVDKLIRASNSRMDKIQEQFRQQL